MVGWGGGGGGGEYLKQTNYINFTIYVFESEKKYQSIRWNIMKIFN